ncbi:MAG TPA: ATP-binding protein [Nitrososphaeraceae archaeon]|nr:ATP-binding protein [Nitrososphaeraceae archaeon]
MSSIGTENLNTKEEEEKESASSSTLAKSTILENPQEIGKQIILLAKTSNEISLVCSFGGMQVIYDNDKFFDLYKKLLERYKRGEHKGIRWVTSILGIKLEKDDIDLIKTFLDLGMQIRHVKNLSLMNFAVSDKMLNATIEKMEGGKTIQSLLTSNDPNYVKHFYSIFEELWNDGIDAADRVKDIEEGIDFAEIEVIQNPKTAITRAWRLLKYAKEEVVILYSSTKAFERQIQMGALQLLNEAATKRKVKVRILLPKSKDEISTSSDLIVVDQTLKERETENAYPILIDVRLVEESIPIRITIVVIDRKECMLIELKDDTKDDSFHAAGLSVYSNSKAIALSYASIFESLWIQTETYEKLKAYSKMQTEFINNAAHELRTPIQPILAISEVLRFEEEKEEGVVSKKEINKYLDVILTNARRLKDLGDNILNVSLIESQSLRLEKELFNLNDIIIDNVDTLKRQFLLFDNDNNPSLEILYDKNSGDAAAEIHLEADKRRISQVIYNLLHNAIKFTNEGSITISVKRKVDDNKVIVVSVNDTGKGIDPEILPRLFSKFVSKSVAGTGLGLFISKSIVEAHGGKMWAENNADGRGATFYFSLPLSK